MKRATVVGNVVAVALLVAGCKSPVATGRIVIGEGTDVSVLLPVIEASALDGEINSLLYLSLNSARWGEGAVEYVIDDLSLAEHWEFGSDSTTLTYFLRPDAVWSDGEPISAADVAFTFELLRRPEIGSPYADSWSQLDSVIAVDRHTVTFYFRRRYPGMLFDTGVGIIPAHVFEDAAVDGETLASHPTLIAPGGQLVVSGPYQVAEWQQGERLVLVANPSAFTAKPETDTVIFRVIPEETTRLIELENGTLDVTGPLSMETAAELDADPRFRIETIDDRFYDYVAWNGSRFAPFADPEIRRALSLGIDRRSILDGLGIARYARPAAGPYPPIFRDLVDPDLEPDPYQPDSARAILAARGWSDSDADGVLDRRGRPFRFTLLTQAGNARRSSAAEIIRAQYAEIGVDMEVRLVEFNALLGMIFEERNFEAVLLGWQVALEPDYIAAFFWPPDHPFNITGYGNAALDRLISQAQAAPSAERAAPYWREAARIIAEDRPYAFLWYFDDTMVLSEHVQNTRIDTYGRFQNLQQWKVVN